MLMLECPWCGPRAQTEFSFEGDASRPVPPRFPPAPGEGAGEDGSVPDVRQAWEAAWERHVYVRKNPRGPATELWWHRSGCGRWLRVRRDTRDHSVIAVDPA